MKAFSRGVVKFRIPILIIALILMIPSAIGYFKTRINYDILTYLPKSIESMKGQDILVDEFGTGAYSMFIVEGMQDKDVAVLKKQIEKVDHVESVLWYDSLADISLPKEMIPENIKEKFQNGDTTMMFIIFDQTTSEEGTMNAVKNIRKIANKNCFLAGMSGVVTDTKNLAEKETPIYVGIAVLLAVVVLSLTMDSYLIPFFFLASIGIAIVYNMGTNIFMGQISFITQSIAAVLQLGVTLDYSIFLWHSYQEELEKSGDNKEAMATAIDATFQSVLGSSITTVAGFVALCFMSFTIGLDLGVVMAKGVIFGVISCITILPAMILIFDGMIEKTRHKPLMKEFTKLPAVIAKRYWAFGLALLVLLPIALYGQSKTKVYYNLAGTLPKSLPSSQAATELDKNYDSNTVYMLLTDVKMSAKNTNDMVEKIQDVDGVDAVIGGSSIFGPAIPESMIPSEVKQKLESDNWRLTLVTSKYKVASSKVNAQIDKVNKIVKSYDKDSMVVGEAPGTKDLVTVTNRDFTIVNWVSIILVFLIIFFVLKSATLPFILVSVIEFAIFINMSIPYYTHTTIPFIASIVIGTIQLGSTVDYAILMTTRYLRERNEGNTRTASTRIALSTSMKSIIVSALSFFSATFGVGMISSIDLISSLCNLMARGALISMVVVLLVLPSLYMIFDPVIMRTTLGMKDARDHDKERRAAWEREHAGVTAQ
jgi:predicted RND superfamily exporter protein